MKKRKTKSRRAPSRKRALGKKRTKAPLKRKKVLDEVGKITHYFPKVKAGIVKITKGTLTLGDVVQFKGHTTDFKQKIGSMELDHVSIQKAVKGKEIGIGVKSRVRQHDIVYRSSK